MNQEQKNDSKFDRLLSEASKAENTTLSLHFSQRVARAAKEQEQRLRMGRIRIRIAFVFSILCLIFLMFIGLRVFPPEQLAPLKDGPIPLVLTAVFCLFLGNFISKKTNHNISAKRGTF